jgi:hypothetical protein
LGEEVLHDAASSVPEIEAVFVLARLWRTENIERSAYLRLSEEVPSGRFNQSPVRLEKGEKGYEVHNGRLRLFGRLCQEVLDDPASTVPEIEAVLVLARRWPMENTEQLASAR